MATNRFIKITDRQTIKDLKLNGDDKARLMDLYQSLLRECLFTLTSFMDDDDDCLRPYAASFPSVFLLKRLRLAPLRRKRYDMEDLIINAWTELVKAIPQAPITTSSPYPKNIITLLEKLKRRLDVIVELLEMTTPAFPEKVLDHKQELTLDEEYYEVTGVDLVREDVGPSIKKLISMLNGPKDYLASEEKKSSPGSAPTSLTIKAFRDTILEYKTTSSWRPWRCFDTIGSSTMNALRELVDYKVMLVSFDAKDDSNALEKAIQLSKKNNAPVIYQLKSKNHNNHKCFFYSEKKHDTRFLLGAQSYPINMFIDPKKWPVFPEALNEVATCNSLDLSTEVRNNLVSRGIDEAYQKHKAITPQQIKDAISTEWCWKKRHRLNLFNRGCPDKVYENDTDWVISELHDQFKP